MVRRYNALQRRHAKDHRALRRRRERCGLHWKTELTTWRALADFGDWLFDVVREYMENGVDVADHVMAIGFPPSNKAYTFRVLRAYGKHFRICDADEGCKHVTFECGLIICSSKGLGPMFVTRTWWMVS